MQVGYDTSYIDYEWYINSSGNVVSFKTSLTGTIDSEATLGVPKTVIYKSNVRADKAVYASCIVFLLDNGYLALRFSKMSMLFMDPEFQEIFEPIKNKPVAIAGTLSIYINVGYDTS